jgi:hypothetical protein
MAIIDRLVERRLNVAEADYQQRIAEKYGEKKKP